MTMKKITAKLLNSHNACNSGMKWVNKEQIVEK